MGHPGEKPNPSEPVVRRNPEFTASSSVTLGESLDLSEPGFLLEANYTLLMELL